MGFDVMGSFWKGLYPMTEAERSIEPAIAQLGIPYRTQFPCWLFGMGKYFPDFLLPTIGVVFEVDDTSHNDPEKQKADAQRTSAFEKLGYVVVRCTNEEATTYPYATVQRLITPELLARKGPPLPEAKFKKPNYRKKKKNGNSTRDSHRTSTTRPSAGRRQVRQKDEDQVGRPCPLGDRQGQRTARRQVSYSGKQKHFT